MTYTQKNVMDVQGSCTSITSVLHNLTNSHLDIKYFRLPTKIKLSDIFSTHMDPTVAEYSVNQTLTSNTYLVSIINISIKLERIINFSSVTQSFSFNIQGGNFHLKVGGAKSSGNAGDPMLGVAVIS